MKRFSSACASMRSRVVGLSPALLLAMPLAGCVGPPTGPTVVALPGRGQSLQEFQANEGGCRNYAQDRLENAALTNSSAAGAPGGAATAPLVGYTDQQRYDVSYAQCMASKGATINNDVLTFSGYPYYGDGYSIGDYWY